MSKRGNVELSVLLAVTAVAVLAGFYLIAGGTTGMSYVSHSQYPPALGYPVGNPYADQSPGETRISMLDCQSYCFGRPVGVPMRYAQSQGGQALQQCLADCQSQLGGAPDINQLP